MDRRHSSASLASEMTSTKIAGSMSRDQKCAPYKHPLFELELKEYDSYMDEYKFGITEESERLCYELLNEPQARPQYTLFSHDGLFKKTCRRVKGENETKVIHRISQLIIPSAEIMADRGAEHLAIIKESTNACWTNSEPFIYVPRSGSDSRSGLRPQPDFGFGFDRDAFDAERLQKLQPFLGDLLADCSLFAATYEMYFPFLTCEVKCGDGGLDVADRQNAYAQSIILRGMYSLFQLVGRERELGQKINGFSISHNDEEVRIWGHYIVIDGKGAKFYRHLISKFIFVPSGEGDQRWKAYKFVKNLYDLWVPNHFKFLCSAIDMLPSDLNFEAPNLSGFQSPNIDPQPSRSGLS